MARLSSLIHSFIRKKNVKLWIGLIVQSSVYFLLKAERKQEKEKESMLMEHGEGAKRPLSLYPTQHSISYACFVWIFGLGLLLFLSIHSVITNRFSSVLYTAGQNVSLDSPARHNASGW